MFTEDLHEKEDVMTTSTPASGDRLLTASEVAELFRVDPKTVTRWARSGKLASIRTPGGQRRFRQAEVQAFLEDESSTESWSEAEPEPDAE